MVDGRSELSGVVLVVPTVPEARRVRERWCDRYPELATAVVLSPRSPWASVNWGTRLVLSVFIDEDAVNTSNRLFRTLLQRLEYPIRRDGGNRRVRVLPRLRENPEVVADIASVVFGRLGVER